MTSSAAPTSDSKANAPPAQSTTTATTTTAQDPAPPAQPTTTAQDPAPPSAPLPKAQLFVDVLYRHLGAAVSAEKCNELWSRLAPFASRGFDDNTRTEIARTGSNVCGLDIVRGCLVDVLREYNVESGISAPKSGKSKSKSKSKSKAKTKTAKTTSTGAPSKPRKPRKRTQKPKGYPSLGKTPYKCFVQQILKTKRAELRAKAKAEKRTIAQLTGEMWKSLSSEEKTAYDALAVEDRARFERELEVWKKKQADKTESGQQDVKSTEQVQQTFHPVESKQAAGQEPRLAQQPRSTQLQMTQPTNQPTNVIQMRQNPALPAPALTTAHGMAPNAATTAAFPAQQHYASGFVQQMQQQQIYATHRTAGHENLQVNPGVPPNGSYVSGGPAPGMYPMQPQMQSQMQPQIQPQMQRRPVTMTALGTFNQQHPSETGAASAVAGGVGVSQAQTRVYPTQPVSDSNDQAQPPFQTRPNWPIHAQNPPESTQPMAPQYRQAAAAAAIASLAQPSVAQKAAATNTAATNTTAEAPRVQKRKERDFETKEPVPKRVSASAQGASQSSATPTNPNPNPNPRGAPDSNST